METCLCRSVLHGQTLVRICRTLSPFSGSTYKMSCRCDSLTLTNQRLSFGSDAWIASYSSYWKWSWRRLELLQFGSGWSSETPSLSSIRTEQWKKTRFIRSAPLWHLTLFLCVQRPDESLFWNQPVPYDTTQAGGAAETLVGSHAKEQTVDGECSEVKWSRVSKWIIGSVTTMRCEGSW